MADYSSRKYKCPVCNKRLCGVVPRGGDGSAYIFPTHKTLFQQATHGSTTRARCKGSRTLIDEDDPRFKA